MTHFSPVSPWSIISTLLLLTSSNVYAQPQLEVCSLCPTGQVVTNGDTMLAGGTAGFLPSGLTCTEADEMAKAGMFTASECVILRASGARLTCGCEDVPTPAPIFTTAQPTTAPATSPVTEAPVAAAPTDPPTVPPATESPVSPSPTEFPTAAPVVDVPATDAPVPSTANPTLIPTAIPTSNPSVSPSLSPIALNVTSEEPSLSPADDASPTQASSDTFEPTLTLLGSVSEVVYIRTLPVYFEGAILPKAAESGFEKSCEGFYRSYLSNETVATLDCTIKTYKLLQIPMNSANSTRSLRSLQADIDTAFYQDTTVTVLAEFYEETSIPPASAFKDTILSLLVNNSESFIEELKTGGNPFSQDFYGNVTLLEGFDPLGPIPPVSPLMPLAPTSSPTDTDSNSSSKLSNGAISGIVVGVVAGVFLLVALMHYGPKANNNPTPSVLEVGNPRGDDPSTMLPVVKASSIEGPITSYKAPSKAQVGTSHTEQFKDSNISSGVSVTASKVSALSEMSDSREPSGISASGKSVGMSSTGLVSIQDSDTEENSAIDGTIESDNVDKDGEDMSYAYSLDAGNMDGTQAGTATKSEDASADRSESGSEMSSHAMSSLRQNMVSRTVVAPPGKLGIVIDTTLEGPVVHKVNPQSPLEGTLFPGDIIVAIDEVDTRAMSASAITALMVRTANLRRKLTVLSEDNTA